MSPASSRRSSSATVSVFVALGDGEAVDGGKLGQSGVAVDAELAEEARVVGTIAAAHEEAVEEADEFRRGDHIDLVAGLRAAGEMRPERAAVADEQRRPRPARDALALGDRTVGMDLVGDDLVVAAARQLELDAVDDTLARRHDHAEEGRHRPDGPALHEE